MNEMKDKIIPTRKDCPAAEKWQLSDIYATREDWQKARDGIPAELAAIQSFKGRLHDPQALLDCLTKQDEMEIALSAVFAWARMMADTDTANQEHQADAASVMPLLDKVGAATAFIEPELLALPEETLRSLPDALPGLAKYRFRLQELLRMKAHILTPERAPASCATPRAIPTPSWSTPTSSSRTRSAKTASSRHSPRAAT